MCMDNAMRNYIERLASDIHDIFQIPVPITNMESVISKLGGRLVYDSNMLISDADGKLRKQGEGFIININPEQSDSRKNFTIAHEIGHLFLHMGYIIDEEKWDEKQNEYYYRKGNNEEEYEANEFAAAFLMPKDEYKRVMDMYTEGNIVYTGKIAEYFNVSASAASNRGKWLGYLVW